MLITPGPLVRGTSKATVSEKGPRDGWVICPRTNSDRQTTRDCSSMSLSSSEYGQHYLNGHGIGNAVGRQAMRHSIGAFEPRRNGSLPKVSTLPDVQPHSRTAPAGVKGVDRYLDSRDRNSRNTKTRGLSSRGCAGLLEVPRTPVRRHEMGPRSRQNDPRAMYGAPGSQQRGRGGGGGSGQNGLPGLGWSEGRDAPGSRSGRRNNVASGGSEDNWRRKTMNLRDGLPTPLHNSDRGGSRLIDDIGHGDPNHLIGGQHQAEGATGTITMGAKSIGGKYPPGMFMGGGKKENQDDWFAHQLPNGDFVAGVLDGHGMHGKTVSNYCKRQLAKRTGSVIGVGGVDPAATDEIERRVEDAIAGTSHELLKSGLDAMDSGATSVTAVKRGRELIVANVGDSRCIVGRSGNRVVGGGGGHGLRAVEMSRDHKPDDRREMERIHGLGGFCEPSRAGPRGPYMGPSRAWVRRQQEGGLAMSRSLGDHRLKKVGVISDPEFKRVPLNKQDKFVVLASDGVWDHLENRRVVDVVARHIDEHNGAAKAAEALADAARKQWMLRGGGYVDDITAVVVKLC